jgi:uncharacterized protein YdeI (YjbR/CyaY-like superfamily)
MAGDRTRIERPARTDLVGAYCPIRTIKYCPGDGRPIYQRDCTKIAGVVRCASMHHRPHPARVSALSDAPLVPANDRASWRSWLAANHATARGAWLVTWRRGHGPVLEYQDAVEEALCFGWVDSTAGRVDERRSKLYFAPRKPGSGWAATNKVRVEKLLAAGLMAPAGIAVVERAKADGSWTSLDAIEQGLIPDDLAAALAAQPPAARNFEAFPKSARRAILVWIASAKRPETRAARVRETAEKAARSERANERPEKR